MGAWRIHAKSNRHNRKRIIVGFLIFFCLPAMQRQNKMRSMRVSPASRRTSGVGGFMSLHFQVYAEFKLVKSKPQLVSTSISSTLSACTTIPIFPFYKTYLITSRIFPTLQIAKSYITYLHGVYPRSPAPPPVLDSGQKDLFSEVSK
jgi:hypothetical protein